MAKFFDRKCITEGCENIFTTQNRKRKYCDECVKKLRKERTLLAFRREVILPNGEVVFLTVREQQAAEMIALGLSYTEVAKSLGKGWTQDRIQELMDGKNSKIPNFQDVVLLYANHLVPKIEAKLLGGYLQGLEQVLAEKSKKDKLDWIKTGLESFRKIPVLNEPTTTKALTPQKKEELLAKAKQQKEDIDKPVDA